MINIIYFAYYTLDQWAQKRDKSAPIFLVLTWTTIVSFYHVATVLSLITIFFRIDASFSIPSSIAGKIAWFLAWGLVVWIILKVSGIREKAYSPDRIEIYAEKKYKVWWLLFYLIGSFLLMAYTTWHAGAVIRSMSVASP